MKLDNKRLALIALIVFEVAYILARISRSDLFLLALVLVEIWYILGRIEVIEAAFQEGKRLGVKTAKQVLGKE